MTENPTVSAALLHEFRYSEKGEWSDSPGIRPSIHIEGHDLVLDQGEVGAKAPFFPECVVAVSESDRRLQVGDYRILARRAAITEHSFFLPREICGHIRANVEQGIGFSIVAPYLRVDVSPTAPYLTIHIEPLEQEGWVGENMIWTMSVALRLLEYTTRSIACRLESPEGSVSEDAVRDLSRIWSTDAKVFVFGVKGLHSLQEMLRSDGELAALVMLGGMLENCYPKNLVWYKGFDVYIYLSLAYLEYLNILNFHPEVASGASPIYHDVLGGDERQSFLTTLDDMVRRLGLCPDIARLRYQALDDGYQMLYLGDEEAFEFHLPQPEAIAGVVSFLATDGAGKSYLTEASPLKLLPIGHPYLISFLALLDLYYFRGKLTQEKYVSFSERIVQIGEEVKAMLNREKDAANFQMLLREFRVILREIIAPYGTLYIPRGLAIATIWTDRSCFCGPAYSDGTLEFLENLYAELTEGSLIAALNVLLDTPLSVCLQRISQRPLSIVEEGGISKLMVLKFRYKLIKNMFPDIFEEFSTITGFNDAEGGVREFVVGIREGVTNLLIKVAERQETYYPPGFALIWDHWWSLGGIPRNI